MQVGFSDIAHRGLVGQAPHHLPVTWLQWTALSWRVWLVDWHLVHWLIELSCDLGTSSLFMLGNIERRHSDMGITGTNGECLEKLMDRLMDWLIYGWFEWSRNGLIVYDGWMGNESKMSLNSSSRSFCWTAQLSRCSVYWLINCLIDSWTDSSTARHLCSHCDSLDCQVDSFDCCVKRNRCDWYNRSNYTWSLRLMWLTCWNRSYTIINRPLLLITIIRRWTNDAFRWIHVWYD